MSIKSYARYFAYKIVDSWLARLGIQLLLLQCSYKFLWGFLHIANSLQLFEYHLPSKHLYTVLDKSVQKSAQLSSVDHPFRSMYLYRIVNWKDCCQMIVGELTFSQSQQDT